MIIKRQKTYSEKKKSSKKDKKDLAVATGAYTAGAGAMFYGSKKLGEAHGIKKAIEEEVGILEDKKNLKKMKKDLHEVTKELEKKKGKDAAKEFKNITKKSVKELENGIKKQSKLIDQLSMIRSRKIKSAVGLGLGVAGMGVGIKKARDIDKRRKENKRD